MTVNAKVATVLQPNLQIPDWGIKSTPAQGCRTGPLTMQPGVPVRQPYAEVDFIPQSGIYEFGYWVRSQNPPPIVESEGRQTKQ